MRLLAPGALAACSRSKYIAIAPASVSVRFREGMRPAGRTFRGSTRNLVSSGTVVLMARFPRGTEEVCSCVKSPDACSVEEPDLSPAADSCGAWHATHPT